MNKIIIMFFAITLAQQAWAAEDFGYGDLTYEILTANTVKVYGIKPNSEPTSINIPSTVYYGDNTYSVTSIGIYAFKGCSSLASVTIPNSVTSIGYEAFSHCSNLTSVTIPNSVTSIGKLAFCNSSLVSITIPNSVTSIGDWAFGNCSSLTEIKVDIDNENYSSVGGVLFNKDKTNLIQYPSGKTESSYSIPNSVTSIDAYAFDDDCGLTSITIPESVENIGYSSYNLIFESVSIQSNADFSNSGLRFKHDGLSCHVLNKNDVAVSAFDPTYFWGDVEIQSSIANFVVTEIRNFKGCSSMTSIIIPESVTSIGAEAFQDCSGLTSITIPNSVTSIAQDAFMNCSNIKNLTYSTNAFDPKSIDQSSLENVVIGKSVTSIGRWAFSDCSNLASVSIPESVTSIGDYAFYRCSSLASVTIPNSVTSIGDGAFYNCDNLTSVTIPESVTSFGDDVFSNIETLSFNSDAVSSKLSEFYSLKTVNIGNSVTRIDDYAFYNRPLGYPITVTITAPQLEYYGNYIFYSGGFRIYVPDESVEIYKTGWPQYQDAIRPISATSIRNVTMLKNNARDTDINWYSLDGRKYKNKPTEKGVYLHQGRKYMVK